MKKKKEKRKTRKLKKKKKEEKKKKNKKKKKKEKSAIGHFVQPNLEKNKAGYTAQDAPSMRTFRLRK